MKVLISEEKLKSFCEKILNYELELYKKELDKKDYSFEGLELFDEVAKKNIPQAEFFVTDITQNGLEQCFKPKVCPSSCTVSFVHLSTKSSMFGALL